MRTAGFETAATMPASLILGLPQPGVRRREDQVERACFVSAQVQLPVRVDVGLDTLKQHERRIHGVHLLDRPPLIGGFLHRHAAGDLQAV